MSTSTAGTAPAGVDVVDGLALGTRPGRLLDRAWEVHPQVSVRPESFGALLYHFGTRRLSFLKDRRLLDVVRGLGAAASAREACLAAGLAETDLPRYEQALETLVRTDMLRARA